MRAMQKIPSKAAIRKAIEYAFKKIGRDTPTSRRIAKAKRMTWRDRNAFFASIMLTTLD